MNHRVLRISCLTCLAVAVSVGLIATTTTAQEAHATYPPVSMAILYDTSPMLSDGNDRRIDEKRMNALSDAVGSFVRRGNPRNEYFVVSFSTLPELILDGSSDPNAALKALSQVISTPRNGSTAMYDACQLGLNKLAQAKNSTRAIVLITDGIDTTSEKKSKDVRRALVESKIVLYAVDVGFSRSDETASKALDKLASASQGKSFHPGKPKELGAVFQAIAESLQSQPPARTQ